MTVGTLLQTIISLVFIYLILALLTSEIQEYLATIFEARAKRLKQSIRQMLGEDCLKPNQSRTGFTVFVPNYQLYENETLPAEWADQHSFQHERAIDRLQKDGFQDAQEVWEKGKKIHPIVQNNLVFSNDKDRYIWIAKYKEEIDKNYIDIIQEQDQTDKAIVRERVILKLEVYDCPKEILPNSSVWQNDRTILPVDETKVSTDGNGDFSVWINTSNNEQLFDNPNNQLEVRKFPIYNIDSVDPIPANSKVGVEIAEGTRLIKPTIIDEYGSEKIFSSDDLSFIWIDTTPAIPSENKAVDKDNVQIDSNHPNQGHLIAQKFPVYKCLEQAILPLGKNARFYFDEDENSIKSCPPVYSLTEKLYEHPDIIALNQSAFPWFRYFGISFKYPQGKKWEREDTFNLITTGLFFLLLLFLLFSTILKVFNSWIFIFLLLAFLISSAIDVLYSTLHQKKAGYTRKTTGPSYIDSSELFANTLLDILVKESPVQSTPATKAEIEKALKSLKFYTPAQARLIERVTQSSSISDWETFKNDLKALYEEVQRRSTGVYKRNAKGLSFLVGLLIAIVANADTFNIVTNLTKQDNGFSQKLIPALAQKLQTNPEFLPCPKSDPYCLNDPAKQAELKELINSAGVLPLGWSYNEQIELQSQLDKAKNKQSELDNKKKLVAILEARQNDCKKPEDCLKKLRESVYSDPDLLKIIPYIDKDFKEAVKQVFGKKINVDDFKKKLNEYISTEKDNIESLENELASLTLANFDRSPDNASQLTDLKNFFDQMIDFSQLSWNQINDNVEKQGGWFRVPFGWLITAIALSMGAPFWFDLLGRVMNVRNAAKAQDSDSAGSNPPQSQNNNSSGG